MTAMTSRQTGGRAATGLASHTCRCGRPSNFALTMPVLWHRNSMLWSRSTSEMMPCVLSWRGGLQGRFSGRLETKDDEKRLADECKLLGPLLGGLGKRGEKSRLTLAKIVRGIATGDVRKYCEERERKILVSGNPSLLCHELYQTPSDHARVFADARELCYAGAASQDCRT